MATETTETGFTNDWQGEKTLAECNLHMLRTADTCDVSFLVGQTEETVRAHSYILISRSCVFYSMLSGQWSREDAIKIPDVSADFFTTFLTFLYTDDCSLTSENVTGLLYLSKKYAVHRLNRLCLSFLQTNLTPKNACVVLEQAHFFDEETLFKDALKVIDTNVEVSLKSPDFDQLCHSCLDKILVLDNLDLHVKPEVVFDRVLSWASSECSRQGKEDNPRNQRGVLGESIYLVGFAGFDVPDFVQRVVPSKILSDSECLKIISHLACPDVEVVPFRKYTICRPEKAMLHTVEMYDLSILPSKNDFWHFRINGLYDALDIVCDSDTVIHSITVPPSDAEYEVTIKQMNNTIVHATCTSTLTNSKLDLPTNVKMMPGLIYSVQVKYTSGKCPAMVMEGLKDRVYVGDKTLNVSQNWTISLSTRGLIMELTMS